jgi:hypothetical protein
MALVIPISEDPEESGGEVHPDDEQDSTDEITKDAPPITRTVIEIPETVLQEYRASRKQQDRESNITRRIALAAALSAWVYAGIATFQWCIMRSQLIAMQKSTDAAKEANQIARDALASGGWPWVGLSGVQPVGFAVGGDTGVQLYFFNSGRTPALRGEHETYIDLTHEQPIGPPETTTAIPTKGGVVLFPQQPAQHVGVTLHNALTSQQLSDMGSGELWLRFWGIVTYHDREGCSHHTWFCGYVDARAPGGQPKTCPHGNDAD